MPLHLSESPSLHVYIIAIATGVEAVNNSTSVTSITIVTCLELSNEDNKDGFAPFACALGLIGL
jgi:hypothetical protein